MSATAGLACALLSGLGLLLLGPRLAGAPKAATARPAALPLLAALGGGSAAWLLGGDRGWLLAGPATLIAGWAARRWSRGSAAEPDLASTALLLELIAAGLSAGLAPAAAIEAVAAAASRLAPRSLGPAAEPFSLVGRLLMLGSEPAAAWDRLAAVPGLEPVAAAGTRCARSGSRLAGALSETAATLRAEAAQRALTRAQRAGVWALLPLGLCFLPAFVCLGVVPVIIGVAGQAIRGGLVP